MDPMAAWEQVTMDIQAFIIFSTYHKLTAEAREADRFQAADLEHSEGDSEDQVPDSEDQAEDMVVDL